MNAQNPIYIKYSFSARIIRSGDYGSNRGGIQSFRRSDYSPSRLNRYYGFRLVRNK
jgi:hypothetical protein